MGLQRRRGPIRWGNLYLARESEAWIAAHELDGVLTRYPLDTGVYEWAIAEGKFTPKQEKHSLPKFIGSFTTASMAHHHYEQGICRT